MSAFDICCVKSIHRPWAPGWFGLTVPFDGQLLVTEDHQPYKNEGWKDRVAFFRTKLLQKVRSLYWVSLDADVQVDRENLELALDYAWKHPSLGGVGIPYISEERGGCRYGTVHMGCAIWQTAATEGLIFTTGPEDNKGCECYHFNRAIIDRGWGIEYHPTATAHHWEG